MGVFCYSTHAQLPHYIEALDKIFCRSKPILDWRKLYWKWIIIYCIRSRMVSKFHFTFIVSYMVSSSAKCSSDLLYVCLSVHPAVRPSICCPSAICPSTGPTIMAAIKIVTTTRHDLPLTPFPHPLPLSLNNCYRTHYPKNPPKLPVED